MKSKHLALVALAAVALVLSSCTTFKISGVQVSKEIPTYTVVTEFKRSITVHKFLGSSAGPNLFNISSDATDAAIFNAIQAEITKNGGDAAINVSIDYKADFIDMVCNGITGSIWAPATAEISGKIVKYTK
jgi:hypothetical protein